MNDMRCVSFCALKNCIVFNNGRQRREHGTANHQFFKTSRTKSGPALLYVLQPWFKLHFDFVRVSTKDGRFMWSLPLVMKSIFHIIIYFSHTNKINRGEQEKNNSKQISNQIESNQIKSINPALELHTAVQNLYQRQKKMHEQWINRRHINHNLHHD